VENGVEHVPHGEDGGPRIDLRTIDRDPARLPAHMAFLFDHNDVESGRGKKRGADKSADTCSNNYDSVIQKTAPPP
jgi:hypothetical protein